MKGKRFASMASITGFVLLAATSSTLAQTPDRPESTTLSGFINAYSAQSGGGPWEIRGEWSLKLHGQSGKADFSAVLTMVRSDYWVLGNPAGLTNPALRGAHTHHVAMVDGTVTPIANGFELNGPIMVTGNGNQAPFAAPTLQVDVTGGQAVAFSNIALTFGGGAASHFGTYPLTGVVRLPESVDVVHP
jgi:hypothetical protein